VIRTLDVRRYVVRCNFCGHQTRTISDGFIYEKDAVGEAISYGWVVTDEAHICPSCAIKEPS
jgi:hypothetical protein